MNEIRLKVMMDGMTTGAAAETLREVADTLEHTDVREDTGEAHGGRYAWLAAPVPAMPRPMRIYVASSWRNALQPQIVETLRRCGHEVYDFRNPAPSNTGFNWREIDPGWESWTPEQYRAALQHPIAQAGYALDIEALRTCDVCVLVLPSGRSASWEFGYAMGQGKRGVVVQLGAVEPELMYREAQIVTTMPELFGVFGGPVEATARELEEGGEFVEAALVRLEGQEVAHG